MYHLSRRVVSPRPRNLSPVLIAVAFALAVLLSVVPASPARAGALDLGEDFFPIGVWSQPIYSFDKWIGRGINTLLKYESYGGSATVDSWANAASAKGLYQIREPRANISHDINDAFLLAWMQRDEPDYRGTPPAELAANYAAWKAVDPAKPVFTNFSGGNVLSGATPRSTYEQFFASTDWVSHDIYPVTGWGRPDWIDYSVPLASRRNPGAAIDTLYAWSGKPQYAIIETSNQQLPWISNPRGVTPDELRGQIWHSIIHGARGIFYFPFRIGTFSYDATPADVAEEMTRQNLRIQSLARVLNSADEPADPQWRLDLDSPLLEGTLRILDGDAYFFILNLSTSTLSGQAIDLPLVAGLEQLAVLGESRSVLLAGTTLVDSFSPFELHVYHAALSDLQPIPEPGSALLITLASLSLLGRRRSANGH
jgi:hypothetical protein